MPCEAFASHSGGVTGGGIVDGQVQRHHTVAASQVLHREGGSLGRSGGVGRAVPCEAFASHSGGVTGGADVDGQVQRHHTVATEHTFEGVGRGYGRSGGVVRAVPSEVVASRGGGIRSIGVDNRQVQRHHTVATSLVLHREGGSHSRSGGVVRAVPGEGLASHSGGVTGGADVDGQVQRHHTVATGEVGRGVGRSHSRSGGVVLTMPGEAVASSSGGVGSGAGVDGQVQRHHTVATGGIGHRVGRSHSRSGGVVRAVPDEVVASRGGGVTGVAVVDSQVQRIGAGAELGIGELIDHVNRLIVGLVVACGPGVGVASRDRSSLMRGVVHRQVQRHDTVATVAGKSDVGVGRRVGVGIVHCAVPFHTVASRLLVDAIDIRVDRQDQRVADETASLREAVVIVGSAVTVGQAGRRPGVRTAVDDDVLIALALRQGQIQGIDAGAALSGNILIVVVGNTGRQHLVGTVGVIPSVVVASHSRRIVGRTVGRAGVVVDHHKQRIGAGTALNRGVVVGESVDRLGDHGIRTVGAVPGVAVASSGLGTEAGVAVVVHREVQHIGTGAGAHRNHVGVVTRSVAVSTAPHDTVANRRRSLTAQVGTAGQGQREGRDTVATCSVGGGVGVGDILTIHVEGVGTRELIVDRPSVCVTSRSLHRTGVAVVDGQRKGNRRVAARSVGNHQSGSIVALGEFLLRLGLVAEGVAIAVASHLRLSQYIRTGVVDNQVQRIGAGAVGRVVVLIDHIGRLVVGQAVACSPSVAVASGLIGSGVARLVDSQCQRQGDTTILRIVIDRRIGTALGVHIHHTVIATTQRVAVANLEGLFRIGGFGIEDCAEREIVGRHHHRTRVVGHLVVPLHEGVVGVGSSRQGVLGQIFDRSADRSVAVGRGNAVQSHSTHAGLHRGDQGSQGVAGGVEVGIQDRVASRMQRPARVCRNNLVVGVGPVDKLVALVGGGSERDTETVVVAAVGSRFTLQSNLTAIVGGLSRRGNHLVGGIHCHSNVVEEPAVSIFTLILEDETEGLSQVVVKADGAVELTVLHCGGIPENHRIGEVGAAFGHQIDGVLAIIFGILNILGEREVHMTLGGQHLDGRRGQIDVTVVVGRRIVSIDLHKSDCTIYRAVGPLCIFFFVCRVGVAVVAEEPAVETSGNREVLNKRSGLGHHDGTADEEAVAIGPAAVAVVVATVGADTPAILHTAFQRESPRGVVGGAGDGLVFVANHPVLIGVAGGHAILTGRNHEGYVVAVDLSHCSHRSRASGNGDEVCHDPVAIEFVGGVADGLYIDIVVGIGRETGQHLVDIGHQLGRSLGQAGLVELGGRDHHVPLRLGATGQPGNAGAGGFDIRNMHIAHVVAVGRFEAELDIRTIQAITAVAHRGEVVDIDGAAVAIAVNGTVGTHIGTAYTPAAGGGCAAVAEHTHHDVADTVPLEGLVEIIAAPSSLVAVQRRTVGQRHVGRGHKTCGSTGGEGIQCRGADIDRLGLVVAGRSTREVERDTHDGTCRQAHLLQLGGRVDVLAVGVAIRSIEQIGTSSTVAQLSAVTGNSRCGEVSVVIDFALLITADGIDAHLVGRLRLETRHREGIAGHHRVEDRDILVVVNLGNFNMPAGRVAELGIFPSDDSGIEVRRHRDIFNHQALFERLERHRLPGAEIVVAAVVTDIECVGLEEIQLVEVEGIGGFQINRSQQCQLGFGEVVLCAQHILDRAVLVVVPAEVNRIAVGQRGGQVVGRMAGAVGTELYAIPGAVAVVVVGVEHTVGTDIHVVVVVGNQVLKRQRVGGRREVGRCILETGFRHRCIGDNHLVAVEVVGIGDRPVEGGRRGAVARQQRLGRFDSRAAVCKEAELDVRTGLAIRAAAGGRCTKVGDIDEGVVLITVDGTVDTHTGTACTPTAGAGVVAVAEHGHHNVADTVPLEGLAERIVAPSGLVAVQCRTVGQRQVGSGNEI